MVKKYLYILLCSTVGAGVAYAATSAGIDFENTVLREGVKPVYGLDDNGYYEGDTFWFVEGDTNENASVIRSYADMENVYNGYREDNPKPSWHHDAAENKGLLEVSTGTNSVLLRTFGNVTAANGAMQAGKKITDGGVYFDAQVFFATYSDPDGRPSPAGLAAAGDKVAVWIDETDPAEPKLVVTAAKIEADGSLTPTNFIASTCPTIGVWHRLTIKAVANSATRGSQKYVGCTLWIDGEQVYCDAEDYVIGAGASRFEGNADYDRRALFPSMQWTAQSAPRGGRIDAVAMSGEFKIDEIALTDTDPFGRSADEVETVVVCDDPTIESLAWVLTRDGFVTTNDVFDAFSGTTFTNYPNDTVELVVVAKPMYTLGSRVVIAGNLSVVSRDKPYTVKYKDPFGDASRVTLRINTIGTNFRYGGETYPTFNEIVDRVGQEGGQGGLVELLQDVTLDSDASADNGQLWVKPGIGLRLDLHGHTIKGTHYRDEAAVYAQGSLTIFDSDGGGVITAPGPVIEVVNNEAVEVNQEFARMQLGDEGMRQFSVKGKVKCIEGELVIMGGSYTNPDGLDVPFDQFYLKEYILNDGRFAYRATTIDGVSGFEVYNDGNAHVVRFETPKGTVTPTVTNVADGTSLDAGAISVEAPGYQVVRWLNGGAEFDLATPVLSNITLVADTELLTSNIKYYDEGVEQTLSPASYTVEMPKLSLPVPTKARRSFGGWKDRATGYIVEEVGAGALFVGTETPVHGELVLDAVWDKEQFSWSNAGEGLSESNGVYGGRWTFKVPAEGSLASATGVKITGIDFCVVNPVTLPKTAPRLAVLRGGSGTPVVSQPWDYTTYLGTDDEYMVTDERRLANQRTRVSYAFDDLEVVPGVENTLYFAADAAGSQTSGFLRLVPMAPTAGGVIGNCETNYPAAPSEEYGKFRPVYEVRGEAVD